MAVPGPQEVAIGRVLGKIGGRCLGPLLKAGKKLDRAKIKKPPIRRGKPPIGKDGNPVELHHRGQKPNQVDEMTKTDHRLGDNYKKNHLNTGQFDSEIDRDLFRKQREEYWKKEWDKGRFDEK